MSRLEKKYRVRNFHQTAAILEKLGASKQPRVETIHYYAETMTNDVVKMVVDDQTAHLHYLIERNGLFELSKKVSVSTKKAGFDYLAEEGFKKFQTVTMTNTDYDYQGGTIGLYLLNNRIASVILHFPIQQHAEVEKLLGLEKAEQITVPYNLYVAEHPNEG